MANKSISTSKKKYGTLLTFKHKIKIFRNIVRQTLQGLSKCKKDIYEAQTAAWGLGCVVNSGSHHYGTITKTLRRNQPISKRFLQGYGNAAHPT
jgi:alpha-glucuronidase